MAGNFPATFERLSSDFPSTLSDFGWRLSTFRRLSDYDQRLSRSEVSDFGWRLSDYDRPPSFRVEVRRFSDLLTGWLDRVPLPVSWCPGVLVPRIRCRLDEMYGKVQFSIH